MYTSFGICHRLLQKGTRPRYYHDRCSHNGTPNFESSGGWWTQRDDALAVIKLIELGRFDLVSMVEDVRIPSEAPEVYRRLCDEKTFPVTQFDWSKEDI